jgi:hypothetical protein
MDLPSTTLVEVLAFLLPGFLAASIYYGLTPHARPIPFERVVQALIFTVLVQSLIFPVRQIGFAVGDRWGSIGNWTSDVQLVWSVILAMPLGLFLAWVSNRDRLHEVLRKMKITDQTSFSSEWYGAFCRNEGYVVLHLAGDRRLYGWPEEWPSVADRGHFVMAKAEWLVEDEPIKLDGVHRILVRASDVEMVELMTVTQQPPGVDHG